MTAQQDMAIQLPFKAEPLDVVVEHGDERFEGRLLARQAHGGVLQAPIGPPVGSILVLYIQEAPEAPAFLVLEGAVVGGGASTPGTETSVIRWNWGWVKGGVALLRDRVQSTLGLEGKLDPACVVLVNPGVAYSFTGATLADPEESERRVERIRLAAARAEAVIGRSKQDDGRPLQRLRAHERVRLDAPCRIVFRDADTRGRIYNIAREGVFVLSDDELPYQGDEIAVRIMVRREGVRTPIDLCGVVRWRAEATAAHQGGGFGVQVTATRDAEGGQIFEAFIERLLAHHYASESAQDWAPVRSESDYQVDSID